MKETKEMKKSYRIEIDCEGQALIGECVANTKIEALEKFSKSIGYTDVDQMKRVLSESGVEHININVEEYGQRLCDFCKSDVTFDICNCMAAWRARRGL